ncbi:hypothetical protein L9F63_024063, partial [Diploptera punctata]
VMLVILVLLIMVFTPSRPLECPTQCRCSNYKTWCKFSRLYKLPSQLPNTTELLSIHYDDIKILNRGMVTGSGLWNLTHLQLNKVQLQQIEPGSFKHMDLLEKLIITNNNITELHADTFKYLNNLYYLNLYYNGIKHIHQREFLHLANVRYLYVNDWERIFPTNVCNETEINPNCEAMKTRGVLELHSLSWSPKIRPIDFGALKHFLCSFIEISIRVIGSGIFQIGEDASSDIGKDAFLDATRVRVLKLKWISFGKITNVFNGLDKLIKLQITDTGLYDIEIGAFDTLTGLKYLDLSNNTLNEIRSGMFRGLGSLKVLKLSYSNISTLGKNAFNGLQSLEMLSLDHCLISTINNDTFIALKSLRELIIGSNKMKEIDADAFNGLSQIKVIKLFTFQYFTSLKNNSLSKLKTLQVFNLHGDVYSIETGAFTEVWSIQVFSKHISHRLQNIHYGNIKYEITLQRVTFIMVATFGDTGIRATVKSVQGHQTLQELQLIINGETPNLKNRVLELIENTIHFTQLNIEISNLNSFETLSSISHLHISHLNISKSSSLIFLANSSLRFPNIQSLTFKYINTLDIHANALAQFKSLTSVAIILNEHVSIAAGAFTGLYNLIRLDIIGQNISESMGTTNDQNNETKELVPVSISFEAGTFQGLHNLKKLVIHGFQNLKIFEGTFLGLHNLEILEIKRFSVFIYYHTQDNPNTHNYYRPLSLTRGMFQGLYKIIEIHLKLNAIKEINSRVFGAECVDYFKLSCKNVSDPSPYCNDTHALKTLQHLDLSQNNIQHIHQHAFISCISLKTLHLERNEMLTLDNMFLFTPALTTLNMHVCNVTNIPNNTFECTPNISELSLTIYNSTLRVTPFHPLKGLKVANIIIFEYKLTCDFYETWYWFEKKNIMLNFGFRETPDIALYNLNCSRTYQHSQKNPKTNLNINDSLYLKQYIEPIILVVITTAGIVFNGFLLFVSLWNSDMRTKHNSCIIHLSITDTLSLILNLPLSYWNTLHVNWELGVVTCKMFMFLKEVTLVANIFSIVALSVERFLVAQISKDLRKACKIDYPIWWLLVMTWFSGIILSVPAYYNSSVHTRCLYCPPNNDEYIKRVWIYQFIVHYFLPAVVICALNTMTSRCLIQSIKNLPGVVNDNTRTKNREIVANIVSILSAIFVFSYLPNFTLRVLVAWSVIDIQDVLVYSFVSFSFFYCNTLFNPISIFIMSSKYKNYFFKYFPFLSNTGTKITPAAKKIN